MNGWCWFLFLVISTGAIANAQFEEFARDLFESFDRPSTGGSHIRYHKPSDSASSSNDETFNAKLNSINKRIDELELQLKNLRKSATIDWKRSDSGSLFKVFTDQRSWDDAQASCQSFNAQLAVIDTEHKNFYVREMLRNTSLPEMWIGVRKKAEMSNSNGFTNFADNQPVDGCTAINSEDGKWTLKLCSQELPFICQQIVVPV